jgi:hypothetical protein
VLDQNEIDTLIRRGKNLLNDGDFAAARVLFERAGSAEAALALGSTYDPNVIKRLGAIMVKPDVEKARQWYQLANLPQSRRSEPARLGGEIRRLWRESRRSGEFLTFSTVK